MSILTVRTALLFKANVLVNTMLLHMGENKIQIKCESVTDFICTIEQRLVG